MVMGVYRFIEVVYYVVTWWRYGWLVARRVWYGTLGRPVAVNNSEKI